MPFRFSGPTGDTVFQNRFGGVYFVSAIAKAEGCADMDGVFNVDTFGCVNGEVDWKSPEAVSRCASFGHQVSNWYNKSIVCATTRP